MIGEEALGVSTYDPAGLSEVLEPSASLSHHSHNLQYTERSNNSDPFVLELTKLQEAQLNYSKRVELEKKNQSSLVNDIKLIKSSLKQIQEETRNGNIGKINSSMNNKIINRLELQLQNSKRKLSTLKNENLTFKNKIDILRREKMLQLQVYEDMIKETKKVKHSMKKCQKETTELNEKNHKIKLAISSLKKKMVSDMEHFAFELNRAKSNITNAQENIMETIRARINTGLPYNPDDELNNSSTFNINLDGTNSTDAGEFVSLSPRVKTNNKNQLVFFNPPPSNTISLFNKKNQKNSKTKNKLNLTDNNFLTPTQLIDLVDSNKIGHTQEELQWVFQEYKELLQYSNNGEEIKDVGFNTLEEAILKLKDSEEKLFSLYNETQLKNEEVEKIELENKFIEAQIQEKMNLLRHLESNQSEVKHDLEKSIDSIKAQREKHEQEYAKNLNILSSVSDNLLNILKNVAVDEAALDQQLLSTGISDRNLEEYLGLVEQRIDELIQMSKAAAHQDLRRDDFVRMSTEKLVPFQAPVPPSLVDIGDDEEDENEGKLQPLKIDLLKDIITKKMQKMNQQNNAISGLSSNNPRRPEGKLSFSFSGARSSTTSLRGST